MLAACLRTNDITYGDVCAPRLGASHSSDSAAETPDRSASRLEKPAADHGSHLKSPPYS